MRTAGQLQKGLSFRGRAAGPPSFLRSHCSLILSNSIRKLRPIESARSTSLLRARASAYHPSPSSTVTAAAGPATGPSKLSSVWSESSLWEEAMQAAGGEDPAARAALGRSLEGLYTLLPDLRPHWREQLAVHQKLVRIEALVSVEPQAQEAAPADAATAATSVAAADGVAVAEATPVEACMFEPVQQAFAELQNMNPFFKVYGTRTAALYHSRSMWVLSEALMRAPFRFGGGPGTPLLRRSELVHARDELQALQRSHQQHLGKLVQAQVELSRKLPELAQLLVLLRQERPEAGVDVGRKVATNLLLLQQSFGDSGTLDRLSLILELEAQESWRRAAKGP